MIKLIAKWWLCDSWKLENPPPCDPFSIDFVFRGKPSLITVICMDPHLPNKLIVTKYCCLIHRDDTSFLFFLYLFSRFCVMLCYFYLFCYYRFFAKLNYYYYYYYTLILFFYKKLIYFFASSVMFWDRCSGFYRRPTKESGSILTSYHQDWCQEIKLFFVASIFSGFYVLPRNLPVKGLNEEIHL